MKFLKKVILENFQSHKYSVVNFTEGLNVIVGPSDSGKSAIIRGIKWALYNEPSGDYFIREGASECSVTLEFNDNVSLKRYRNRYKNVYILIDRDGNELKFEGFGSSVPQEVIDTVGIKKINLDSDSSNSINLGEQLEGAFLLSEKTAVRASAIGRLVGVNIIDDALKDVLRDNRNLNINKKNIEENIVNLQLEIEKYDYLEKLKQKHKKLELLKNKLLQLDSKVETLEGLRKNLSDIRNEKETQSLILNKLVQLSQINEIINIVDSKIYKHKSLNNYHKNLINVENLIIESHFIKDSLAEVDNVKDKLYKLEVLCRNLDQYRSLNERYNKLLKEKSTLTSAIKKLDKLDVLEINLNNMSSKYDRLNDLNSLKTKLGNILNSVKIGRVYLNRFKDIDICNNNSNLLSEKTILLNNYLKIYNKLLAIENDINKELTNLNSINTSTADYLNKYQELLKKVEICPFCLSDIDQTNINHIINHYIGG